MKINENFLISKFLILSYRTEIRFGCREFLLSRSDRKLQSMFIMNDVFWALRAISSYSSCMTLLTCVEYVRNYIFRLRRKFQVTFIATFRWPAARWRRPRANQAPDKLLASTPYRTHIDLFVSVPWYSVISSNRQIMARLQR